MNKLIIPIFAISVWILIINGYGIRYNSSASLPYHLFISSKIVKMPERHTFVSFIHPNWKNLSLAKQVIGIPGDAISIRNQHLYLNGIDYGEILPFSNSGKAYHPIPEGKIPEDSVFVYGSEKYSFDSRYQEFGLVKIDWIKDQLWPFF